MEQKKTLWIVAAAGVFLLVVIGAALILYSPAVQNKTPVQTSLSYSDSLNSFSSVSSSGNENIFRNSEVFPENDKVSEASENSSSSVYPAKVPENEKDESASSSGDFSVSSSGQPVKFENVTLYSDNVQMYGTSPSVTSVTTVIDLNALKPPAPSERNYSQAESFNEPKTEPKTQIAEIPSSVAVPQKKVAGSKIEQKTEQKTESKTVAKPVAKKTAVPAKKTASKPAETKASVPDIYWIQVGSYEVKKLADEARKILENNKIPNEVFTHNEKGKLFYRVRVGPYTTKQEAQYWQKCIRAINEFSEVESYIAKN